MHEKAFADWYQELISPVNRAALEGSAAVLRAAKERALRQADSGGISADAAQAVRCYITYLEFKHACLFGAPKAERQAAFEEASRMLAVPGPGPASEGVRRRLRLQLHIKGALRGGSALPPREFLAVFHAIPDAERTDELWYHCATYAFLHGLNDIVEQAYERYVVDPLGWVDQHVLLRFRLLHLAAREEATPGDLVEMLQGIARGDELEETAQALWPAFEHLGLTSPDALAELEAVRLRQHGDPPPGD